MIKKQKTKFSELTIDFGPFYKPIEAPPPNLFQRVKSEMLKRR